MFEHYYNAVLDTIISRSFELPPPPNSESGRQFRDWVHQLPKHGARSKEWVKEGGGGLHNRINTTKYVSENKQK